MPVALICTNWEQIHKPTGLATLPVSLNDLQLVSLEVLDSEILKRVQ